MPPGLPFLTLRTAFASFFARLSTKHLFVGFYFDELPDQSCNSGVEALLLLKVIVKEFAHMNSRDE
jgi:hypothetical protein